MQIITQQSQELWFNSKTADISWLSNFHPVEIEYENIKYQSVEAMYQAQKFPQHQRQQFSNVRAAESKKLAENVILPINWNVEKLIVMRIGLRLKFSIDEYRTMLDNTGMATLIHLSPWDLFWGMDKNRTGANVMGNMLMDMRDQHRSYNIF
jgi:ribA/ribD-fused uncharacterized protein